jgi:hypothetical protein
LAIETREEHGGLLIADYELGVSVSVDLETGEVGSVVVTADVRIDRLKSFISKAASIYRKHMNQKAVEDFGN